jgi:hypothetical protein
MYDIGPPQNTPAAPSPKPNSPANRGQSTSAGFKDCGPTPVAAGKTAAPDVQAAGIGCSAAQAVVKANFPGYRLCGEKPPPNPPMSLRNNPPPWGDWCSGTAVIIEAGE